MKPIGISKPLGVRKSDRQQNLKKAREVSKPTQPDLNVSVEGSQTWYIHMRTECFVTLAADLFNTPL